MVAAVNDSGGVFLTVSEDQILDARERLAFQGIDVEPTSAAAWGAWIASPQASLQSGTVVVALTGAGLKATT